MTCLEKAKKSWKNQQEQLPGYSEPSAVRRGTRKTKAAVPFVVSGIAGIAWAVPLTCINQLYRQVPFQRPKIPAPLFCSAAEISPGDATSATL